MASAGNYCSHCGGKLKAGDRFCSACGQAVDGGATGPGAPARGVPNPAALALLGLVAAGIGFAVARSVSLKPAGEPRPAPAEIAKAEPKPPAPAPAPGPLLATVPDVLGLTADEARAKLESAGGFPATFNDPRYDAVQPKDRIAGQHPAPGAQLKRGDTVYLAKSLGPQPEPPVAGAVALVKQFMGAMVRADSAGAKRCLAKGADTDFDLGLIGQGDFKATGFEILGRKKLSATSHLFTVRQNNKDWEGVVFCDRYDLVVSHSGGKWAVAKLRALGRG
jgi:hypothetical protein